VILRNLTSDASHQYWGQAVEQCRNPAVELDVTLDRVRSEISQLQLWAGDNPGAALIIGLAILLLLAVPALIAITTYIRRSQTRGCASRRKKAHHNSRPIRS